MYDLSLRHPFSMLIVGPSGSGKTVFVTRLLENAESMIQDAPHRVKWFYGAYQPLFASLPFEFQEGAPTVQEISEGNMIVVIDDLMNEAQEQVSEIFTKMRHHSNITCIFLCQNLFPKGPFSRNISLNSNYIVLMKNPRDKAQVAHLARQVFPKKSKFLIEAYEDATSNHFSYLLLDFHPSTDDSLRMRAKIFPGETMVAYVPKL